MSTLISTAHSLDQIKEELRRLITEQTDAVLTVEEVRELTGLSKSAIYQKTCSLDGNPPELPRFKRESASTSGNPKSYSG